MVAPTPADTGESELAPAGVPSKAIVAAVVAVSMLNAMEQARRRRRKRPTVLSWTVSGPRAVREGSSGLDPIAVA